MFRGLEEVREIVRERVERAPLPELLLQLVDFLLHRLRQQYTVGVQNLTTDETIYQAIDTFKR